MADESMEHAPDETTAGSDDAQQRPAFGAEHQGQFDEAIRVLIEQGRHGLVQRVFLILDQRQLGEAMRVLYDDDDQVREHYGWAAWDPTLDEFRGRLDDIVRGIRLAYDERETFGFFHQLVLMAARETAGFRDRDDDDDYSNGGFGAVPAPAAAVAGLEKRTFHAGAAEGCGGGVTECSICFEGFVDGAEVSVMPCPSRGHEFHTGCIAKWLGVSNIALSAAMYLVLAAVLLLQHRRWLLKNLIMLLWKKYLRRHRKMMGRQGWSKGVLAGDGSM